jgi:hypothetical protein
MLARQALYHLTYSVSPVFLCWILSRYGLANYLPRLASNSDPPDLCLPVVQITSMSSQNQAKYFELKATQEERGKIFSVLVSA